jgi:predicted O-methyltransferase YrrM
LNAFSDDPRHTEDLHAWHVLRPLLAGANYLPWSTGAMRPAGLVLVCNEIVLRNRTRIVECGSGVSTVVLARLLRQRASGATIVALEHDAHWAALVTDMLRRESLLNLARVVQAPLADDPPWYGRGAMAEMPDDVDLLVVDGPPAQAPGHGTRRAPALAAFEPRLTETATVILDDANRPGEQQVLTGWESETSWRFTIDPAAGVAIGQRDESGRADPRKPGDSSTLE